MKSSPRLHNGTHDGKLSPKKHSLHFSNQAVEIIGLDNAQTITPADVGDDGDCQM